MIGQSVGQYNLISKIGEGGMGVVYEAEQQHPKRRVALKVIRGGQFVDEATIRMFQREAQSLALLKHASIASIYESGHTDDGAHFFAMELVQGKTLDEWLAGRASEGLSQAELQVRLGLFRQICEGVSYAHQRGVIHRDLKPGNILVLDEPAESSDTTRYQGPGIKILDFGLARITETDVQVASMVTEVGTILGTLHYMSPEQVQGIPGNIDVRSDVYALGVLLYEILTRHLPYPIREAGFHDALGIILDTSPTPLSKLWPGDKKVARDLEIIALKALEKDVSRRYQSALALAEDIDHFLNNQPILARAPSTIYQLQKMVKRHTVPSALVASLIVLVIGFSFISVAQARRANLARDESEAVTGFLSDMLLSADPTELGRDVLVQDVLDVAAGDLDSEFGDQPLVKARLHHTIGIVYNSLSQYSEAREHLLGAIDIRKNELGDDDPTVFDSVYHLAATHFHESRYNDGLPIIIEASNGYSSTLGDSELRTLSSKNLLALFYLQLGRIEEAEQISLETMEHWRDRQEEGVIAEEGEKVEAECRQTTLGNLFGVYMSQGRFEEAQPIVIELLEADRIVLGPEHPYTLGSMHNVAFLFQMVGRLAEADSVYMETLELRRRIVGDEHSETLGTMGNLAEVYAAQSRYSEAEALFDETLEIYARTLGKEHQRWLRYSTSLAGCLIDQGKYDEAEPLLLDVYGVIENSTEDVTGSLGNMLEQIIRLYELWEKPDKAGEWRAKLPPGKN